MHTGAAAEAERCDSVEGFAEGIDAFGEEPMGDRQRERPGVLVGQFDSEPEERAASVADVVDDDTWRSGQVVGKYFKPGESAGGGVSVFQLGPSQSMPPGSTLHRSIGPCSRSITRRS